MISLSDIVASRDQRDTNVDIKRFCLSFLWCYSEDERHFKQCLDSISAQNNCRWVFDMQKFPPCGRFWRQLFLWTRCVWCSFSSFKRLLQNCTLSFKTFFSLFMRIRFIATNIWKETFLWRDSPQVFAKNREQNKTCPCLSVGTDNLAS